MRIGCLFGTFDPPHRAHVAVAEHMRRTQGLDAVWLMVTPLNPFKRKQAISPDAHRMAMARLAVEGHPGLQACDFELGLPRPNYTVDTLRAMRARWPEHRFSLIIGSDNLEGFGRWKEPEGILAHHEVLVHPRPGALASPWLRHPRIRLVADAPLLEASATAIRRAIAADADPGADLAPAVLDYIRRHGLYRN